MPGIGVGAVAAVAAVDSAGYGVAVGSAAGFAAVNIGVGVAAAGTVAGVDAGTIARTVAAIGLDVGNDEIGAAVFPVRYRNTAPRASHLALHSRVQPSDECGPWSVQMHL